MDEYPPESIAKLCHPQDRPAYDLRPAHPPSQPKWKKCQWDVPSSDLHGKSATILSILSFKRVGVIIPSSVGTWLVGYSCVTIVSAC